MLNKPPYYHETIRNCIIGFAKIFSDLKIERKKANGTVEQTLLIPIAYAPKEKWIQRIEQDPTLSNQLMTTLPRLSFEMTGLNLDATRKVSRMASIEKNKAVGAGINTANRVFSPVPYNLDINLYCISKNTEDGLQIVEQILPYFTPEFTMSIQSMKTPLDIVTDVPIILNSVTFVDEYDGTFETRRFVTWTLGFQLKLNLFGYANPDGKIISKTIVDIGNPDRQNTIIANLNTGGITSETWEDIFKTSEYDIT
jgi:hypothetical protein